MKDTAFPCPSCQSLNSKELVNDKLVTFFFPVPASVIKEVQSEKIRIYICKSCSHVFQVDINEELINKIYSNFYDHYNLDTSIEFQKIYRDRTIRFIEDNLDKNGNKNSKVLDIGCGEGTFFPFFSKHNYDCYGFEPSNKSKIAIKNNPNAKISPFYFEQTSDNIFEVRFDVILLNWVLEHVTDLDNFLKILKQYCKLGTKIVFQVPDLLYYVENDLYLFYVHEHIHYFTPFSIEKCLERFGFRLLNYKNEDCPSLLVCAEYVDKRINNDIIEIPHKSINDITNFVVKGEKLAKVSKGVFEEYNEIYLYGVGTPTYWLGEYVLNDALKSKVKVIDDNEFYFGKFVPLYHCKVTRIEEVRNVEKGMFFIGASPVYRKSIIDNITTHVTGEYDIVFIDDNVFKINSYKYTK